MATLAQLRSEPWWDREIVTPELSYLGTELTRRTGRPIVAFGAKGNTAHLRGAHRSQEWILNSAFATSRTSTVQSGLSGTQARHIAGADWTPGEWGSAANRALMVQQTRRLRDAMVMGHLNGLTQVIGTLDGRTVVGTRADGSTFSSDSSHLDHWHLTFDRRRLTDRALMDKIISTVLGEESDDDMARGEDIWRLLEQGLRPPGTAQTSGGGEPVNWLVRTLAEVKAGQAAQALRDQAILAAVQGADGDAILARVDQHAAQLGQRLTDLADQHAAQLGQQLTDLATVVSEQRQLLTELDAGTLTQDELVSRIRIQVEAVPPSSPADDTP